MSDRRAEYWYLARKLEQRLIDIVEGAIKGKKQLKKTLRERQTDKCGLAAVVATCPGSLSGAGHQVEVDRVDTRWNHDPTKNFGYFEANCRAVHAGCHRAIREERDTFKPEPWLVKAKDQLFIQVEEILLRFSQPS